jgi:hypothetical protein
MFASRGLSALVVSAGTVLLACACTTGSSSPSSTSTPSPASVATTGAPLTATSLLFRVSGQVVGAYGGNYPSYSVQAGGAWSGQGAFVIRTPPSLMGISVWDAIQVPIDPCRWQSTMTTPGPTVEDLVHALVAQRTRNATTPTEATLAGYKGMRLEWSVPPDMVDGEKCDPWPDNGYRDFVSFLGPRGSERYQQVANQIDRLWVLDVNGQRLVVDATYGPDTTDAQKAELEQVVESLKFDKP